MWAGSSSQLGASAVGTDTAAGHVTCWACNHLIEGGSQSTAVCVRCGALTEKLEAEGARERRQRARQAQSTRCQWSTRVVPQLTVLAAVLWLAIGGVFVVLPWVVDRLSLSPVACAVHVAIAALLMICTLWNLAVAACADSTFDAEAFPAPRLTVTNDAPWDGTRFDGLRVCRPCAAVKPRHVHHCTTCGVCVDELDHHCIWLGLCIGRRNRRGFILFLFYAFLSCVYALAIAALSVRELRLVNPSDAAIVAWQTQHPTLSWLLRAATTGPDARVRSSLRRATSGVVLLTHAHFAIVQMAACLLALAVVALAGGTVCAMLLRAQILALIAGGDGTVLYYMHGGHGGEREPYGNAADAAADDANQTQVPLLKCCSRACKCAVFKHRSFSLKEVKRVFPQPWWRTLLPSWPPSRSSRNRDGRAHSD